STGRAYCAGSGAACVCRGTSTKCWRPRPSFEAAPRPSRPAPRGAGGDPLFSPIPRTDDHVPMMMTKQKRIYVLDTNVLMHDTTALFRFEEHDVFLPMTVLEELDHAKKGSSEVSRN